MVSGGAWSQVPTSWSQDCNKLLGLHDPIEVLQDAPLGVLGLEESGGLGVSLIDRILQISPLEDDPMLILARLLVMFLQPGVSVHGQELRVGGGGSEACVTHPGNFC